MLLHMQNHVGNPFLLFSCLCMLNPRLWAGWNAPPSVFRASLFAAGVYLTCDDSHVWLAPFTPGALHTVSIVFDSAVTLGMLRIFNYNKNRIHSLRGAR